jgi:hypothetical protein
MLPRIRIAAAMVKGDRPQTTIMEDIKMSYYDQYYEEFIEDGMDDEQADQMASLECAFDDDDFFGDKDDEDWG